MQNISLDIEKYLKIDKLVPLWHWLGCYLDMGQPLPLKAFWQQQDWMLKGYYRKSPIFSHNCMPTECWSNQHEGADQWRKRESYKTEVEKVALADITWVFPSGPAGKKSSCSTADKETWVQTWGPEDPLGEENGNPLQYSYLENPMDSGVAKSQTQLNEGHTHNIMQDIETHAKGFEPSQKMKQHPWKTEEERTTVVQISLGPFFWSWFSAGLPNFDLGQSVLGQTPLNLLNTNIWD